MSKSRILKCAMTAAALLTVAPALAEESRAAVERAPAPACCERVPSRADDRAARATERGGDLHDARQPARAADEDLFQQRPYWNGP